MNCKLDVIINVVVEVVYKLRPIYVTGVLCVSPPKLAWVGIGHEGSEFHVYIFNFKVNYN